MPSKLLIVKDNRDHISAIVHELAKVWNIHVGKENLRVFGIHDCDEFDSAFKCDFVLFLLNNETLSFENQVPKWLCKLGHYGRPTNNEFEYLVVREFRPSSEQIHIADRTQSMWTENETERKPNERNIDETRAKNVDEISHVLKWWPCVIQHTFKARNARCKVHVETDDYYLFDGSEAKLKVGRTREDIQDFLAKFNALATASDDSKSHQLFIIGDPSKFYETHKHLRQEKINGSKIMLIIVGENKHHPELTKISTSQISLSNMVGDILQVMVDLGIVSQRKTLKKIITVNQVKDPIKTRVNKTALKVTWSFKSEDVVLLNQGYVSVQVKNSRNGRWEELKLKEASGLTDEIDIPNRKIDEEFQVMFEDAKTGILSTPVCINNVYLGGIYRTSVLNRILCFLSILMMIKSRLEAILMMLILCPLGLGFYLLYVKYTKSNCILLTFHPSFWFAFAFEMLMPYVFFYIHFSLMIVWVANIILSVLSYEYLSKIQTLGHHDKEDIPLTKTLWSILNT